MRVNTADGFVLMMAATIIVTIPTTIAAWGTHVIWCLQHHEYLLLFVGALFAPVGVIHGVCVWLGVPWL